MVRILRNLGFSEKAGCLLQILLLPLLLRVELLEGHLEDLLEDSGLEVGLLLVGAHAGRELAAEVVEAELVSSRVEEVPKALRLGRSCRRGDWLLAGSRLLTLEPFRRDLGLPLGE